MQVLLAVVDAGSLSAGARKLNAPLPSVSRKVADLERHLGTRLLIRTSRNIQLTDAGRDFIEATRQIIAQLNEAELRASGEYEVPRGELSITTPMAFGREVVLPLAYEFLNDYPEINLRCLSVDRPVQLLEERIDVGFRLGELADSSLYATKLGDFSWVTCASPAYLERKGVPLSPDDLTQHDGVVYDHLPNVWTYQQNGRRIEAAPRIRVCTSTSTTSVRAAVQGMGLVRAASYQVAPKIWSGELVSVLDAYNLAPKPVHLVYARQGLLPAKVRAFIDWMTPRMRSAMVELLDLRARLPAAETPAPLVVAEPVRIAARDRAIRLERD
ncbi:LysR family transcriptional regulator [Sphingomonas sp. PR090111-T3T-6A]|uniref:LysR family transcriptional regulator n=1 Tax=Sphingomonas sp. PR090111-T3T-6A TaxID=685778 RepID=UPI001F337E54|nr:LysR family transcriptional regulator [Sphingomonas sp. PR090111-T3T-6A]